MATFPILLRLEGRKCLVVGAGRIATGKTAALLRYGAQVIVVAPKGVRWMHGKGRTGELVWRRRAFAPRDVRGMFLVVAATNSPETNHAVFRSCRAQGVLCNVVDDPEYCDFFYPAVVNRGPLQIAISTDGNSPALAARLRKELERQFPPEWGPFVKQIGRVRQQFQGMKLPAKKKREEIAKLAELESFLRFRRQMLANSRSTR
jgi:precorrin-2 dehydrogenase/sirohydrochlorin ferrochelatase